MICTRVKICGIASPEDARLTVSLGADYLGLIFTESPRRVTVDTAREIRKAVPSALLVGVFKDDPLDDVAKICNSGVISIVQLHGTETPEYCGELMSRSHLPIIKTVSESQLDDADRMRDYRTTSFFLFDLDKPSGNGTGPRTNGNRERLWSEAAKVRRKGYRIFLAGALDASNVHDAVHQVKPYCVDVASGVEKSPGVKDRAALERFMAQVKR